MTRFLTGLALTLAISAPAFAQGGGDAKARERAISLAASPAPAELRAGAEVRLFRADGTLETVRAGTNDLICLGDDPAAKRFHVSCYHKELEPYMARGRALRQQKKSEDAIDSIRVAEAKAGRLKLPSHPAALFQYFAPRDSVDAGTGVVRGASYLYLVYTPYATTKTTGFPTQPIDGGPWLMFPGTPFAHLMISPQKTARVEP
jgi:hypothetical protein